MDNTPAALLTSSTSTGGTTTTNALLTNDTIYNIIKNLLNGSDLYHHQIADLLEPEKYSTRSIHAMLWTMSILTYLIAIPIVIRIVRTKAYLNVIDYFSFHIVMCAFVAWIPSLILILYQWFQLFTLRFCRIHYILLSTNETVSYTRKKVNIFFFIFFFI